MLFCFLIIYHVASFDDYDISYMRVKELCSVAFNGVTEYVSYKNFIYVEKCQSPPSVAHVEHLGWNSRVAYFLLVGRNFAMGWTGHGPTVLFDYESVNPSPISGPLAVPVRSSVGFAAYHCFNLEFWEIVTTLYDAEYTK